MVNKNEEIFVKCDDLINLCAKHMEDEEICDALDIEMEKVNGGLFPKSNDCIYRVTWPEHCLRHEFNSDARYQIFDISPENDVWEPSRQFWTNY